MSAILKDGAHGSRTLFNPHRVLLYIFENVACIALGQCRVAKKTRGRENLDLAVRGCGRSYEREFLMTCAQVQTSGSVWDALEETQEAAATMRLRSELMTAARTVVEQWQMTQTRAARRLGIAQPRLNDLLRGRIGRFSLDALIALAERAGLSVLMEISGAAA